MMRIFLVFLLAALIGCVSTKTDLPPIERIPSYEAKKLIDDGALVIDVRSDPEFAAGHLPMAIHIVHTEIADHLSEVGKPKDRPIVVYCHTGRRAGIAAETLQQHGYTKVFNAGGYDKLAERF